MKRFFFAAFFLIQLTVVVTAQNALTGANLAEYCAAPENSPREGLCVAYVRGLAHGLYLGQGQALRGTRYCPPEKLSVTQARLIIEKYLRDRPQDLHLNAELLASVALYLAFPCPKTN